MPNVQIVYVINEHVQPQFLAKIRMHVGSLAIAIMTVHNAFRSHKSVNIVKTTDVRMVWSALMKFVSSMNFNPEVTVTNTIYAAGLPIVIIPSTNVSPMLGVVRTATIIRSA